MNGALPRNKLRNQHLRHASLLLHGKDPSTSAYLAAARFESEKINNSSAALLAHLTCTACGTFPLTIKALQPYKSRSTKATKRNYGGDGLTLASCGTCQRAWKFCQATRRDFSPVDIKTAATQTDQAGAKDRRPIELDNNPESKASSKKRAKVRKESLGLQALLEQSRQDSKSASTLDLMDFMTSV